MSNKIRRPKSISTDRVIELINELIDEEYGQPRLPSQIKISQLAGLIRLVSGFKINPSSISCTQDVYEAIGWEYTLSKKEIEFLPPE